MKVGLTMEIVRHLLRTNEIAITDSIICLGISFDGCSRFPGARAAPGMILNWISQHNPKLLENISLGATVPIPNQSSEAALKLINEYCSDLLSKENRLLLLGGDHSITVPAIEAMLPLFEKVNYVVFDAHDDCDDYPVIRNWNINNYIFNKVNKVMHIGGRNDIHRNVEQISMLEIDQLGIDNALKKISDFVFEDSPLYLSVDLDVLDPSEFPGVSYPEPGGLTFRELSRILDTILNRSFPVIIDLVEFNPVVEFNKSARVYSSLLSVINKGWRKR